MAVSIKKKIKKMVTKVVAKTAKKKTPVKKLPRRRVLPCLTGGQAVRRQKKSGALPAVSRHGENPIVTPNESNAWESKATFNPAAVYAGGRVHLMYRAIGDNDVSVLGYASSGDAINIDERLTYPIFYKGYRERMQGGATAARIIYGSGGGWNGGCEDPRLTVIDGKVYLLYIAFDGWGSLRMAMTIVSLDDFLHKRFNWSQPVYISRPGEIHKNWVLFPEKINGKFALLHSISPKVLIEYVDDIAELGRDKYVNSFYGSSNSKEKVAERWDSWVRGAGPPPLKTKYGWLLLYHAMSDSDPNRYKLGAMILDMDDPTKVLYRSNKPLLEPDECYENEGWKAGVVYSCGAVVVDGKLYIYYGGADKVLCVASADLDELLEQIISNKAPIVRGLNKHGKAKSARY